MHAFTSEAREKLSGRRVEGDNHDADDLPGGLWISHVCHCFFFFSVSLFVLVFLSLFLNYEREKD